MCDKNPPTPCLWQAPANNKPPPPPCAVAKLNKEPTDKKKSAFRSVFGVWPWALGEIQSARFFYRIPNGPRRPAKEFECF